MFVIDENHVIDGMFFFFYLFVFYTTSFYSSQKSFEEKFEDRDRIGSLEGVHIMVILCEKYLKISKF